MARKWRVLHYYNCKFNKSPSSSCVRRRRGWWRRAFFSRVFFFSLFSLFFACFFDGFFCVRFASSRLIGHFIIRKIAITPVIQKLWDNWKESRGNHKFFLSWFSRAKQPAHANEPRFCFSFGRYSFVVLCMWGSWRWGLIIGLNFLKFILPVCIGYPAG